MKVISITSHMNYETLVPDKIELYMDDGKSLIFDFEDAKDLFGAILSGVLYKEGFNISITQKS